MTPTKGWSQRCNFAWVARETGSRGDGNVPPHTAPSAGQDRAQVTGDNSVPAVIPSEG